MVFWCVAVCAATPVDELLDGVETVARPGIPGTVVAFGEHSGGLLQHGENDPRLIAAWADVPGRGRVVLFGHGGYLTADEFDTKTLIQNAVLWLGRNDPVRRIGSDLTKLGELDVLVLPASRVTTDAQVLAIVNFLDNGGSWLTAATGWGWEQIHGRPLRDGFKANAALASVGLAVAGDLTDAGPSLAVVRPGPHTNALAAFDLLTGEADAEDSAFRAAGEALRQAVPYLPRNGRVFQALQSLDAGDVSGIVPPGTQRPEARKEALGRVATVARQLAYESLPPHGTPADPTATTFPGTVDGGFGGKVSSRQLDLGVPRWRSLDWYAVPGEVVSISATGLPDGAKLRIGSHSDRLYHKPTWQRFPEISRTWPLADGQSQFTSPFGGIIYLEVPEGATGEADVRVTGAAKMPWFVLGETTPQQWRSRRDNPGPWAELACDSVIFTVPSSAVRDLDDPTPIMEHWQAVQAANAKLAGIDPDRPYPMRIVNDVQISAGYMHAGYPIMTHLDMAEKQLDLDWLRSIEAWGFYHELGHNHQKPAWTWSGLTEVTCNLFSMYVLETVCDLPPEEATKRALVDAKEKIDAHLKRVAAGEESNWKADPFVALGFYADLRMHFGWEPFEQVFREYEEENINPRTDRERRSEFYRRMSLAVDRDLGPYFEAWGVAITPEARRGLVGMEPWQSPRVDAALGDG